jgi:hypothetical protein
MGTIRSEQTRLLQDNGTENIEFFVYDKDGNAKASLKQSKDVLKQIPSNLSPINQDLQVEYLRPLRDAVKTTKTNQMLLINKNPNFRYKTFNWDITASKATVQIPSQILFDVNPISGLYCLYQEQMPQVPEKTTYMIKNILSDTPIVSGRDIEIAWNYYMFAGGLGSPIMNQYISVGLDSTSDGTINKMYDFGDNKFIAECSDCGEGGDPIAFTDDRFFKKIDYTQFDSWNKYKTTLQANLTGAETNPHIEIKLFQTTSSFLFGRAFYDGFEISQKSGATKRIHIKRRGNSFKLIDGAITEVQDNVTGEYDQKETILSNELDLLDVASIPFEFTRKNLPLSINTNTLDKNVLQEIINDYRNPVKRYEGTFYKDDNDTIPIYFYNKLWVNYTTSVLQEPVSAIIDELEYDVKQNSYRIVMHLPNQDDDKVSFDLYKFE